MASAFANARFPAPQLTSFPGSFVREIIWLESHNGKVSDRPHPHRGRDASRSTGPLDGRVLNGRFMVCIYLLPALIAAVFAWASGSARAATWDASASLRQA